MFLFNRRRRDPRDVAELLKILEAASKLDPRAQLVVVKHLRYTAALPPGE